MSTEMASNYQTSRPIERKDYDLLFRSDQAVYPTNKPVTTEVVDGWYQHNREFGTVFTNGIDESEIAGVCFVIPLSKTGWENLTLGKKSESEMRDEMIFDPKKNDEIGLHCYHIERFDQGKGFYVPALKALNKTVNNLGVRNVLGFSGYAVTNAGLNLLEDTFNAHEEAYVSQEHIMSRGGKLEVVELHSMTQLNEKLDQGYVYQNRCKMLITRPGDISLVWRYLKPKNDKV